VASTARPRFELTDEPLQLRPPRWLYQVWIGAVVLPALLEIYIRLGSIHAAILTAAALGAHLAWVATTYRRAASRRTIPWCIATIVATVIHAWEQWAFGYTDRLLGWFPATFAEVANDTGWFYVMPLGSTLVFLVGVIAMCFHHPIGNYLAWLLCAVSIVIPISHPLLAVASGELTYLPGMVSGLALAVLGAATARRLVTDRVDEAST
jgi:hypothetical protein